MVGQSAFALLGLLPLASALSIGPGSICLGGLGICFGGGDVWTSKGCYTDQSGRARTLSGASYVDSKKMTTASCVSFCAKAGYHYAGVEYGEECYCDYAIQYTGTPTAKSECDMACSGNKNEKCGAGSRLNIFYSGDPDPKTPTQVGTWKYSGCYVDDVQNRALERPVGVTGGVSVQGCINTCKAAGFQYAGMEYGAECYCGNSISSTKVADNQCHKACEANHGQYCGGPDRLTVYHDQSAPPPVPTITAV